MPIHGIEIVSCLTQATHAAAASPRGGAAQVRGEDFEPGARASGGLRIHASTRFDMAVVVLGSTSVKPGKTPREAPDEEALKSAARRVAREVKKVQSLAHAAELYRQFPPDVLAALHESCLLHVRKLRSFFYDAEGNPEEVFAGDYFSPPWAWDSARPTSALLQSDVWVEAERELCAIRGRPFREPAFWETFTCRELADETMVVASAFLRALPVHRARWFRGLAPSVTDLRPS